VDEPVGDLPGAPLGLFLFKARGEFNMGDFSVEIWALPGSLLNGNQHNQSTKQAPAFGYTERFRRPAVRVPAGAARSAPMPTMRRGEIGMCRNGTARLVAFYLGTLGFSEHLDEDAVEHQTGYSLTKA
jgi:hypothetical protein